MKRTTASAAAILLIAGTAGPAFAKGHSQPADPAQAFGQLNADENYIVGGETAKVLARDETPGVDADVIKMTAQTVERVKIARPTGKPE